MKSFPWPQCPCAFLQPNGLISPGLGLAPRQGKPSPSAEPQRWMAQGPGRGIAKKRGHQRRHVGRVKMRLQDLARVGEVVRAQLSPWPWGARPHEDGAFLGQQLP